MVMSFKFTVFIVALSVLVGCAVAAKYQAMIVTPTATERQNSKLKGAIVVVKVSGGKKTNPLWASQVENDGFRKALEGSLDAYGYLAGTADKAKYKLDANLISIQQPVMSFEPDVKAVIAYKIYGAGFEKNYTVKTVGIAKFSDAFFSDERFRIANENSVHKNIEEFLKQLSRL